MRFYLSEGSLGSLVSLIREQEEGKRLLFLQHPSLLFLRETRITTNTGST